jgi:hypothetical protein
MNCTVPAPIDCEREADPSRPAPAMTCGSSSKLPSFTVIGA